MEGSLAQLLGPPPPPHNFFSHLLLPPTTLNEEISEGPGFHPSGVGLGVDSVLGQCPLEEAGDQRQANKTSAFVQKPPFLARGSVK